VPLLGFVEALHLPLLRLDVRTVLLATDSALERRRLEAWTYLAWSRLRDPENAEAYARRTLLRLALRASSDAGLARSRSAGCPTCLNANLTAPEAISRSTFGEPSPRFRSLSVQCWCFATSTT